MNSGKKHGHQVLGAISEARAQALLLDWINLEPSDASVARLLQRYPDVFLNISPEITKLRFPARDKRTEEQRRLQYLCVSLNGQIGSVKELLRKGWDTTDPRQREWCFISARLAYHIGVEKLQDAIDEVNGDSGEIREVINGVVQPVKAMPTIGSGDPRKEIQLGMLLGLLLMKEIPLTSFEAAMFYLQNELVNKIRRCPNPSCPAPYFFATKKGQKFCSLICAGPTQRESKRKWWNENRAKA